LIIERLRQHAASEFSSAAEPDCGSGSMALTRAVQDPVVFYVALYGKRPSIRCDMAANWITLSNSAPRPCSGRTVHSQS
jgi:hypothetical protein